MNSNATRAVAGAAVIVVAIVLLVVLEEKRQQQQHQPTRAARSRRSSSKTASRSAASRSLTYNKGEQVRFKVDSDVSDEVHVHGYDIMKDVKAGGSVSFDFPADDRRGLRGRAGGPQGTDHRTDGQPVSLLLPVAHALVARKDLPVPAWLFAWGASIVLIVSFFALSAAWRKPRFEEERWRPLGAGLSRVLLGHAGAGRSAGRSGSSCSAFSIYAGLHGTEAPDRNFALTFIFVTAWLGFPLFSVILGDVFRPFNPWRAIGRMVGGAVLRRRRAAPGPPRLPRGAGALAGRDRPARVRLAGGRLRRQRRRRGRALARTPPAVAALVYSRLHAGDDGRCSGSRSGARRARSSRSTSGCSPGSAPSGSGTAGWGGACHSRRRPTGRPCRARPRS